MEKIISNGLSLFAPYLKGKGKLSHLTGTGPKPGDPRFEAWDEKDYDHGVVVEFYSPSNH